METIYRKVAVTVKAVQFTDKNKDSVYNWAKSIQANVYHDFDGDKPILKIPTLEGEMICSIGDYLIIEPFPTDWRKLYPCKPSIFNQTYELLDTEITDNTAVIEKLEAEKKELLEALEASNCVLANCSFEVKGETSYQVGVRLSNNESLIQKHKQ